MASPCRLYIVSGPIGNLSDITYRALEVLKSADLIISEDTRETSKLLNKYNINTKQISYRDETHNKVAPKVIELINSGKSIAMTSDSGTPLISDPGFKLVRECIKNKISIIPIPGPSAVISAICASGLPTDKFSFLGFLPKKKNLRRKILLRYGSLDSSLVIFESPFRIKKLMREIYEILGNRYICICREMTKIHEEFVRGNVEDILEINCIKEKGEFVVIIAKKEYSNE